MKNPSVLRLRFLGNSKRKNEENDINLTDKVEYIPAKKKN
jgi:hypothetical protein